MDPLTQQQYIKILVDTNEQLNYGFSLTSNAIGIMALILTIAGIATAVLIWKNSKDQRDATDKKLDEFFKKNREEFENFLHKYERQSESLNRRRKKYEKKLQGVLNLYEDELNKAGAASKKRMQEAIDDLKREKLSMDNYLSGSVTMRDTGLGSTHTSDPGYYSALNRQLVTCLYCGQSFGHKRPDLPTSITLEPTSVSARLVKCPYCGKEQFI